MATPSDSNDLSERESSLSAKTTAAHLNASRVADQNFDNGSCQRQHVSEGVSSLLQKNSAA